MPTSGGDQHHRQDHHDSWELFSRQIAHRQRAAERAHDHDALKAEVDDAGVLGEAAAQRHQNQYGGEDQGVLQQQTHA